MKEQFKERMKRVVDKFGLLMQCRVAHRHSLPPELIGGGVYVFSLGGECFYVGRGKKLRDRILQHARPSVVDAPLAFRRVREVLKLKASYAAGDGRKQLVKDPVFMAELLRQKQWVATLEIRYVVEEDPVSQALLEIYASDCLGTPYNDFNTT